MRGLIVPEKTKDFTADPVEIFFDLAFVYAFSQLVGVLLHDPTWATAGRSLMLFLLLWLPWTQFTWSANSISGNSREVRILFLVATAMSVPMAAAVPTAFGDGGLLFAIPLAIIVLTALAMLLRAHFGDTNGSPRAGLEYALLNIVAMAVIIAGGVADESLRVAIWCAGIAIFLIASLRTGSEAWYVRPGHFAERHGLIILVALGEVIVALGNAIAPLNDRNSGLVVQGIMALLASGAFAGLLWWSYFDRVAPAFEHKCVKTPTAGQSRYARDVYTYAHAPIVAGIILSAVALEEVALHPDEAVPGAFRLMAALGLTLIFGGIGLGVWRSFHIVAIERLTAIVAVAVLMAVGDALNGLWLLITFDVILVLTLLVEHHRIERAPEDGSTAQPQASLG